MLRIVTIRATERTTLAGAGGVEALLRNGDGASVLQDEKCSRDGWLVVDAQAHERTSCP